MFVNSYDYIDCLEKIWEKAHVVKTGEKKSLDTIEVKKLLKARKKYL